MEQGTCVSRAARRALVWLGCLGWIASVGAGSPPPDHFRLAEFSEGLYRPVGSQRLTVVGDSINATSTTGRMIAGYRDSLQVKWNGWVVHADSGASDIGYLNGQNLKSWDFSIVYSPGNSLPGGQFAVAPVRTRETVYRARPAPGSLVHDCMMLSSATAKFPAGDFFSTGHVTARVLLYQDLDLLRQFMIRGMRGNTKVGQAYRYTSNGRPEGIVYRDIDLGTSPGSPRVQMYNTPVPSWVPGQWWWSIATPGVLFRNSLEDGVQMSFISMGGYRTVDHSMVWHYTDKALGEYFEAIGAPTHLMLWLGQNQTAQESNDLLGGHCTVFKQDLKQVMDRYNAVIAARGFPAPRWLLVSQYKTGYSAQIHELLAEAEYELAQENANVSFLNLYALAGGTAFDSAQYTTDGIHPNADGSRFLAARMDTAMRSVLP